MSKPKLKYLETKLIKRKKKSRGKGFKVFIVCLVLVIATIFISGSLGDILKISPISVLFGNNSYEIKEHSYFAVLMGEYNTRAESEAVASGVAVMGAAAYVWELDGKFLVVGNVYKNKSDAEIVLKNVSGNNYSVSVKEIPFNKISLKEAELTDEQTELLVSAVKFLDTVYERCYDYSVKFDKGEVVATIVSSELNSLKGEVSVWANKLDLINSYMLTNKGVQIKNSYISVGLELEKAVLSVISGNSVNKDLKYLTTAISVAKFNLYKNINSY